MISTTWKFEIFGEIPQKPAIIIFWHGFMLPVWKLFSNKYAFSVISKSKDGEL